MAVVTVGNLIKQNEWLHVLGLVFGAFELNVGIPLAVVATQQPRCFSSFGLSPIVCLARNIILISAGKWNNWITVDLPINSKKSILLFSVELINPFYHNHRLSLKNHP